MRKRIGLVLAAVGLGVWFLWPRAPQAIEDAGEPVAPAHTPGAPLITDQSMGVDFVLVGPEPYIGLRELANPATTARRRAYLESWAAAHPEGADPYYLPDRRRLTEELWATAMRDDYGPLVRAEMALTAVLWSGDSWY